MEAATLKKIMQSRKKATTRVTEVILSNLLHVSKAVKYGIRIIIGLHPDMPQWEVYKKRGLHLSGIENLRKLFQSHDNQVQERYFEINNAIIERVI